MAPSTETPFYKRMQIGGLIVSFIVGIVAGGVPTYLVQHHNEYLDKQTSDRRDAYKDFYTQVEASTGAITKAMNVYDETVYETQLSDKQRAVAMETFSDQSGAASAAFNVAETVVKFNGPPSVASLAVTVGSDFSALQDLLPPQSSTNPVIDGKAAAAAFNKLKADIDAFVAEGEKFTGGT